MMMPQMMAQAMAQAAQATTGAAKPAAPGAPVAPLAGATGKRDQARHELRRGPVRVRGSLGRGGFRRQGPLDLP
jgi:hypothetical protein